MTRLVVRVGGRELKRVDMKNIPFHLGRDETNHLVLDNAAISRRHAQIDVEGTDFVVKDLDSKMGLAVNGKPLQSSRLQHGDIINVGKFANQFK